MMQHTVSKDHLTEIGDITVSFTLLEFQLQSLIGSLIYEHQRIGQIVTAELSFRNLRDLLISLYLERHGEDEDFEILQEFMKRSGKIEEKRNQITHSIWAGGKDKNHIIRIKTTAKEKHGISFKSEQFSVNDLSDFVKVIKVLSRELSDFQIDLMQRKKVLNLPIQKFWP